MEKKSSIELLRVLLFFMVVTIHVTTPYLIVNFDFFQINWQLSNLLDGISRISVDCFVIITGYFCITLYKNKIRKQWIKLIAPLVCYLLVYYALYIFEFGVENMCSTVTLFLQMILDMLKNATYFYHFWYLQVFFFLLERFLKVKGA